MGNGFAPEHGIQKIDKQLDVRGGRGVLAVAQMQPELVFGAKMLVDLQRRPVCLLESERTALRFREARIQKQPARRYQGHQQVLVYRQFVFMSGEEAQPGMEPVWEGPPVMRSRLSFSNMSVV